MRLKADLRRGAEDAEKGYNSGGSPVRVEAVKAFYAGDAGQPSRPRLNRRVTQRKT